MNLGTAPGGELVGLRSVRVVQGHEENGAVDVRKPVGIEIRFRVLGHGDAVFPKIKVYDSRGTSRSTPWTRTTLAWTLRSRRVRHHCVDPWEHLNEGLTTVDVSIATLGAPKLLPHASGRSAVAFHVQDPAEGDSARGLFTGQWQGVVRPMLEWTTEASE